MTSIWAYVLLYLAAFVLRVPEDLMSSETETPRLIPPLTTPLYMYEVTYDHEEFADLIIATSMPRAYEIAVARITEDRKRITCIMEYGSIDAVEAFLPPQGPYR